MAKYGGTLPRPSLARAPWRRPLLSPPPPCQSVPSGCMHAAPSGRPRARRSPGSHVCVCTDVLDIRPNQGQLQGADLDTALAEADGFGTKLCAPLAC